MPPKPSFEQPGPGLYRNGLGSNPWVEKVTSRYSGRQNSKLEIAAEIELKVALYSPLLLWKVFLPYCKWSNRRSPGV